MVKKIETKLISKAAFARMANVTAAAVTKAIANGLSVAMEGKRIDANHPSAVKYVKSKTGADVETVTQTIELDPLHNEAVAFIESSGKTSVTALQRELRIGYNRARNIIDAINGVYAPQPEPEKDKNFLRGYAAKNAQMKQAGPAAPIDADEMLLAIPEDIRAFADMSLRELVARFGTDTRFVDWLKATKSIEDINEKRLKNAVTEGELVSRNLIKLGIIDPIDAAHIKLLTDGAKTIALRATTMHGAGRPLDDIEKFVKDQITSFIRPIKAKVARTLNNA